MTTFYTINQAAIQTGLSPSVLRIWELRYGYPKPKRGDNGYRKYTQGEVDTLKRIGQLTARGVPVGELIIDGLPTFPTTQIVPERGAVIDFTSIPLPVTIKAQTARRELEDAIRTRNVARIRLAQQLVPTIHPTDRENAVLAVIRLAGVSVTP